LVEWSQLKKEKSQVAVQKAEDHKKGKGEDMASPSSSGSSKKSYLDVVLGSTTA
jgi:hypothetical protein